MDILVIGSGGREHAIIEKLFGSPLAGKIYALPGNAGTLKKAEAADADINDHSAIAAFVREKGIGLTVVGPENPLTAGIVDYFEKENLLIFGPTAAAAEIEASKVFSKNLMKKYNIPTAEYRTFKDFGDAEKYLRSSKHPIVVKASGLAAGKGAVVCADLEESLATAKDMLVGRCFGQAGDEVVIEEFMTGEEASVFAISDGEYYKILVPAQDHKAAYDGDKGPNTGGMGAYAPAPVVNEEMMLKIAATIIGPTLDALRNEGRSFKGVLFAGLMITDRGPKVIEFNCRFGDPETQVILPLLDTDLLELILQSLQGGFKENGILPVKNKHCLSLVLASGGYPGPYLKGFEINGLEKAEATAGVIHAGTAIQNGKTVTSGGRVLNIVAAGDTLKDAKKKAYEAASVIDFQNKYFRTDIGDKGISHFEH